MNDPKRNDTRRTGDWTGDEWAGGETNRTTSTDPAGAVNDPEATAERTEHWNKSQYAGDHGEGVPARQDPDTMPEGETSISGNRHTPGEEHWAPERDADATTRP
ncbi:MAG TPA: hypothetical protein VFQ75_13460 [Candidatus Limnocylindrales bacterium]|nr:hypothetical protein [Candidatus Limnocylindrales bacterium]